MRWRAGRQGACAQNLRVPARPARCGTMTIGGGRTRRQMRRWQDRIDRHFMAPPPPLALPAPRRWISCRKPPGVDRPLALIPDAENRRDHRRTGPRLFLDRETVPAGGAPAPWRRPASGDAVHDRKAQRFPGGPTATGPAGFVAHCRRHRDQDIPRGAARRRRFQELCRARSCIPGRNGAATIPSRSGGGSATLASPGGSAPSRITRQQPRASVPAPRRSAPALAVSRPSPACRREPTGTAR